MIRTYSELIKLITLKERYLYLKLEGSVGRETFGFDRYLNQKLYSSPEWKKIRRDILVRDNACDLGLEAHPISRFVIIHHMNPISRDDIVKGKSYIFDPEYLICTSRHTHNAIHFSNERMLPSLPIERSPNDTCPWKGEM